MKSRVNNFYVAVELVVTTPLKYSKYLNIILYIRSAKNKRFIRSIFQILPSLYNFMTEITILQINNKHMPLKMLLMY